MHNESYRLAAIADFEYKKSIEIQDLTSHTYNNIDNDNFDKKIKEKKIYEQNNNNGFGQKKLICGDAMKEEPEEEIVVTSRSSSVWLGHVDTDYLFLLRFTGELHVFF